jgi:tetrapyrrole methylase family protein / MazG family protein
MTDSSREYNELMAVVQKLLSPEGCPWDREQTHDSLKNYLIEESYELIEAIENDDHNAMEEELGDVLFQVVFHAGIADNQHHKFSMNSVLQRVTDKMVNRHPHVFGDVDVDSVEDVWKNWDTIKKKEKLDAGKSDENISLLASVPKHLPALLRAEKLQKRAARSGFDWDNMDDVWAKVKEEVEELKEQIDQKDEAGIKDEFGDCLFALVNVARKLGIDAEDCLQGTNKKFFKRFAYVEEKTIEQGKTLEESTLDEMDQLWEESKSKKG